MEIFTLNKPNKIKFNINIWIIGKNMIYWKLKYIKSYFDNLKIRMYYRNLKMSKLYINLY